jgi:hypothetical protein
MSLRAASWHLAAGLKSAPPPVKAFICFRMAAMALVSPPESPEPDNLSSFLASLALCLPKIPSVSQRASLWHADRRFSSMCTGFVVGKHVEV